MSITLSGNNPKSDEGVLFFCTTWEYHAIVEYLEKYVSAIPKLGLNLHFLPNGFVFSEQHCEYVLASLYSDAEADMNSRSLPASVAEYISKTSDFLDSLPLLDCQSCLATGLQRKTIISPETTGEPCRECDGSTKSRPYIYNYKLKFDTFSTFLKFLASCGGFTVK